MINQEPLYMTLFVICRDTRVYLTCDKSADTPIATTEGDSTTPLSYVGAHG